MPLACRSSRFADRALLTQAAGAIWRRVRARIRRVAWPIFRVALGTRLIADVGQELGIESGRIVEYRGGESVTIPEPYSVGAVPKSFSMKVGTWSIGGPWYATLEDARLLGPTAVAYTPDNGVVGETVIPENYASREAGVTTRSLCMSLIPPSRLPTIDSACSMVGLWSKGYFEWVVEFLPRLEAVTRYRERTGEEPRIIVDSRPSPWQLESLELMGYHRDDLIAWNGRGSWVRSLLIPSFPRRLCEPGAAFSIVSPSALRWTRASILANLPPRGEGAASGATSGS